MTTRHKATVEDLYRIPGKAELVNGKLVLMEPSGDFHGSASGAIHASLRDYQRRTKTGRAYPDGVGFLVELPNRDSFSPDAAYYVGPRSGEKFLPGAPIFAAEVRSANGYGPAAEREMAAKRADYFAAGTLVVWDVALRGPDIVRVYRANSPNTPTVYRRGDLAEAEPAVPGWRMPVDELFE
jgi:Uma2 family endonuclease